MVSDYVVIQKKLQNLVLQLNHLHLFDYFESPLYHICCCSLFSIFSARDDTTSYCPLVRMLNFMRDTGSLTTQYSPLLLEPTRLKSITSRIFTMLSYLSVNRNICTAESALLGTKPSQSKSSVASFKRGTTLFFIITQMRMIWKEQLLGKPCLISKYSMFCQRHSLRSIMASSTRSSKSIYLRMMQSLFIYFLSYFMLMMSNSSLFSQSYTSSLGTLADLMCSLMSYLPLNFNSNKVTLKRSNEETMSTSEFLF